MSNQPHNLTHRRRQFICVDDLQIAMSCCESSCSALIRLCPTPVSVICGSVHAVEGSHKQVSQCFSQWTNNVMVVLLCSSSIHQRSMQSQQLTWLTFLHAAGPSPKMLSGGLCRGARRPSQSCCTQGMRDVSLSLAATRAASQRRSSKNCDSYCQP